MSLPRSSVPPSKSLSGDDDPAVLPPSGQPAILDMDLEIVAMLARAAERVGLEWKPPLRPEPLRLDDWFLGVARAGSQGPTPVPFFPEVYDELTGSWTAPFGDPEMEGAALREMVNGPLPPPEEGRMENLLFLFSPPLTSWSVVPKTLTEGTGSCDGPVSDHTHSSLSPVSSCGRFCLNAGKCCTHADPASDWL